MAFYVKISTKLRRMPLSRPLCDLIEPKIHRCTFEIVIEKIRDVEELVATNRNLVKMLVCGGMRTCYAVEGVYRSCSSTQS